MTQQLKFLHQSLRGECYRMNSTELKHIHSAIKRAKSQRNATTNNEDFDYWQGILEQYQNKLQTGEKK
jgi:hypothetical protein